MKALRLDAFQVMICHIYSVASSQRSDSAIKRGDHLGVRAQDRRSSTGPGDAFAIQAH